mgnify:CR=1 FL=1
MVILCLSADPDHQDQEDGRADLDRDRGQDQEDLDRLHRRHRASGLILRRHRVLGLILHHHRRRHASDLRLLQEGDTGAHGVRQAALAAQDMSFQSLP